MTHIINFLKPGFSHLNLTHHESKKSGFCFTHTDTITGVPPLSTTSNASSYSATGIDQR